MKVKSSDQVLNILDEEFAWRRKELTAIWNDVNSSKAKLRSARIRAAVAMLYAHWEGFVKVASEVYLNYVAGRRLKYNELNAGFLALCLRSKLRHLTVTGDISQHINFLNFVFREMTSRAEIPKRNSIKTGSNLSSSRLKTIVLGFGLDYSPFELKEHLIDKQLLDWRNTIAHGKWLCPNEDEFSQLYRETTTLLRNFKDQLANAIVMNRHLKMHSG